jgi:hypothetical protein
MQEPTQVPSVTQTGCINPGCQPPASDWGNFSSSYTRQRQTTTIRCSVAPRGAGQNGACPQPTYLSSPSLPGGNSSQAYLLGKMQQLAACGGYIQNTGYPAAYSALQIPLPQPCSLIGTSQGKYATSESRFQMYSRPGPAPVCPGPSTAELNSTMPHAVPQQYCVNIAGIIQ